MKISKTLAKQYRDALDQAVATADFEYVGDGTFYAVVERVTPYNGVNSLEIDAGVEVLRQYVASVVATIRAES